MSGDHWLQELGVRQPSAMVDDVTSGCTFISLPVIVRRFGVQQWSAMQSVLDVTSDCTQNVAVPEGAVQTTNYWGR